MCRERGLVCHSLSLAMYSALEENMDDYKQKNDSTYCCPLPNEVAQEIEVDQKEGYKQGVAYRGAQYDLYQSEPIGCRDNRSEGMEEWKEPTIDKV